MRIIWDAPIAMPDGVVLRADIFLPLAEGRYPVLMSQGPYAKWLSFQVGYPNQWSSMVAAHPDIAAGSTNKYQAWEVIDPEKWVPHGYAVVRVDSRGAGRSPGLMDAFSALETDDYCACIEWAGTQPWSSGAVGLCGISYYAVTQWQVAGRKPPHLAAICPWEGGADFYRDLTHHGGMYMNFWDQWMENQILSYQHGKGENGYRSSLHGDLVAGPETLSEEELEQNRIDPGKTFREPFDGPVFQDRSAKWDQIDVPFLSSASWAGQGLHPRGNFEAFMNAASKNKWLEVHGLEHWTHFVTDYGRGQQKRFFDHFLKGEDNGWDKTPRVILNIRDVNENFTLRYENEWPLARTQWTKFYLDAAGRALGDAPLAGAASVAYEGMGDGVTFFLPPQTEQIELCGPMAARLYVSSETEDADLFLIVRVFRPDGKEVVFNGTTDPHTPFAQGWLRASHRKLDPEKSLPYRPYHSHDEKQPLAPGRVYELDIEIWPTGLVIPEGYRIALTVQGRDYEWPDGPGIRLSNFSHELRGCGPFLHNDPKDRPAEIFGGKVTIHTGRDHPSFLLLPVIP
ncbi:MAG TPA: CocE/NonD family hydrolase [Caulobacteraceae bacterium]|jgi:hypothetical protein|nr:CocE/NonD family hydrolase [Caulobacteraceae bacterium]